MANACPAADAARVHHHRPPAAERLRLGAHLPQLDERAREIEFFLVRPAALDRVQPLLRVFVARVMLAHRRAEHGELVLVPAAHHVQPEAALADMIGGDELLGGDHRMDQRRVHRAEYRDPLRGRQQPGRPGDGFQRLALVIGVAAVALPAAHRQHELDPDLVGQARQAQAVGPASAPALRDHRHGAAGRAIRAEQAELQRLRL